MSSIYDKADNEIIISRINNLLPETNAKWGKMIKGKILKSKEFKKNREKNKDERLIWIKFRQCFPF